VRRALVLFVAFLSGAVFLALEIVSSRVLAPAFGSSIHVWGSLISVFLLALTLGYFLGGRLADRRPSYLWLACILFWASAFVLLLPLATVPASQWIAGLGLDFRLGTLIACLAFFLAPSVLMGMVSPYVIKLLAADVAAIGRLSGTIYAVSTLGSILGALGVSFFLIPVMGTRAILLLCGALLIACALVSLLAHAWRGRG
jgi:MFS family permease